MELDLSSLQKAITALDSTLQRASDDRLMSNLDDVTQNAIRAGVIQHFEFSYELCWKFIQRWLRINVSPEEADPMTRKDLFRTAARYGLIRYPEAWFVYGDARNLTAHTYDAVIAEQVYLAAGQFLGDAKFLLAQLEARNA